MKAERALLTAGIWIGIAIFVTVTAWKHAKGR